MAGSQGPAAPRIRSSLAQPARQNATFNATAYLPYCMTSYTNTCFRFLVLYPSARTPTPNTCTPYAHGDFAQYYHSVQVDMGQNTTTCMEPPQV